MRDNLALFHINANTNNKNAEKGGNIKSSGEKNTRYIETDK